MKPISALPNAAVVQTHYFGLLNAPGTDQNAQPFRRIILSVATGDGGHEYVLARQTGDLPQYPSSHPLVVLSPDELQEAVREFTGRKLTVIHEAFPAQTETTV